MARSKIQPFPSNNSHQCSMLILNNLAFPDVVSVLCNKKLTEYHFCKMQLSKISKNTSNEGFMSSITTCKISSFKWSHVCLSLVGINGKDKLVLNHFSDLQSVKNFFSTIQLLVTEISLFYSNLNVLYLDSKTSKCYSSKRIDTGIWQFYDWIFKNTSCETKVGFLLDIKTQKRGFQTQCAEDIGGMYECSDGTCITDTLVCDGIHQCMGGEDELNCCYERTTDQKLFCETVLFHCESNKHIHYSLVSDGERDCSNTKDEFYQYNKLFNRGTDDQVTAEKQHKCLDGKNIPSSTWNDLIPDCDSNEQEDEVEYRKIIDCPDLAKNYNCPQEGMLSCELGHSRCFYMWQLCLYDRNELKHLIPCRNGAHLMNCSSFECNAAFKCFSFYCVPFRRVCDGVIDCVNGEDETACPWKACPGLLKCRKTSYCVDPFDICNNKTDCPSEDDEILCSAPLCSVRCICLGFSIFCNNTGIDSSFSWNFEYATIKSITIVNLEKDLNPDMFNKIVMTLKIVLTCSKISHICFPQSHSQNNPLLEMKSLLYLEATRNLINTLYSRCFSENQYLKILNLSANIVTKIVPTCFNNLKKLNVLDMSHNEIDTLTGGIFHPLQSLNYLNLNKNPLTYMLSDIFPSGEMSVEIHSADVRFCCMVNIIKSCQAEITWFESCDDLLDSVLLRACVWLTGISSSIFNIISVVIHILNLSSAKKVNLSTKLFGFLAICLNSADLSYSAYMIILASVDIHYTNIFLYHQIPWRQSVICSLLTFLSLFSFILSNFILVIITYRKLVGVVYPLETYTQTKSQISKIIVIGTLTAMSISLSLPYLDRKTAGLNSNTVCILLSFENPSLAETLSSLLFIVLSLFTLLFLTSCYTTIYIIMRKENIQRKEMSLNISHSHKIITPSLLVIKITNIVSWISVAVIYIITISGFSVPSQLIKWMTVLLLPLNCVINPSVFIASHVTSKCKTISQSVQQKSAVHNSQS